MNIAKEVSRRRFLEMSAALGGLAVYGEFSPVFTQEKQLLTEDQVLGPFYPIKKPPDRDADLTHIRGHRGSAKGQTIHLMGRVVTPQGKPLPGVRLEIWQANIHGRYAHINDSNLAPLDPNFQGYGVQVTDAKGQYRFKTIKPGAYPTGIEGWTRPPHIHFYVAGRNEALVTQMYFPGEALNAQDRLLQSSTPNQATLMAKVDTAAEGLETGSLVVTWDIVLPRG